MGLDELTSWRSPAKTMTLSISECASELGIGRTLAYQLARTGAIPTIRLGQRLLVPRAQLERMLSDVSRDPNA